MCDTTEKLFQLNKEVLLISRFVTFFVSSIGLYISVANPNINLYFETGVSSSSARDCYGHERKSVTEKIRKYFMREKSCIKKK